jgi:hypothetical protein
MVVGGSILTSIAGLGAFAVATVVAIRLGRRLRGTTDVAPVETVAILMIANIVQVVGVIFVLIGIFG